MRNPDPEQILYVSCMCQPAPRLGNWHQYDQFITQRRFHANIEKALGVVEGRGCSASETDHQRQGDEKRALQRWLFCKLVK